MPEPHRLHDLTDEEIRQLQWYYQVELRPGVSTDGRSHPTAGMVREFLERMDLHGTRCLDIGTQEALIPVSLARLGAGAVVAYDRLDLTPRIDLVKQAYGVDFDYRHGIQLNELSGALRESGYAPFDVVVFAGVLYHMIDPLGGLGMARSFVRQNGLLVVETAAIVSNEMALYFNDAGRYAPRSCYFLPSLTWLDYCLRMLRLRPIECRHISASKKKGAYCRVAVVCRAEDRPLAFEDDNWMTKHWVEKDFSPYALDYAQLASDAPAISYAANEQGLRFHRDAGSVDIFKTVKKSKRRVENEMTDRLNLADYTNGKG